MGKLKERGASMLFVCWLIYTSAYFCRVNLSLAIPSLQMEFGWDKTTIGMLSGAFFWAYAAGQLINGRIGDQFNPRYFVAIGLFAAGLCNIGIGLACSFGLMLALWLLNGYFQSMLWGPIIRTASAYTPPEKRSNMAVLLSTSMVAGYLIAYQSIGRLAEAANWRAMFFLPGAALIVMAAYWAFMLRHFREDAGIGRDERGGEDGGGGAPGPVSGFAAFLWRNGLLLIALVCVVQGLIKEGMNTWGPTFLSEAQHIDFSGALNLLSFVPALNLCGVLLAGVVNRLFRYRERNTLLLFCTLSAVSAAALYFSSESLILTILFYSLVSTFITGLGTVLISLMPLNFYREGRVSTTAGFVNCASYIGASLSGPLLGMLSDHGGWKETTLFWAGAVLLCGMLILFSRDYKKTAAQTADGQ
ncbi:MAG: MFS transporter [Bacillota bacterium]